MATSALSTATVTPSWWPTAGVHAVAAVASSLRTQKTRLASHPAPTPSSARAWAADVRAERRAPRTKAGKRSR